MNQSEELARIAVTLVDRCMEHPATPEDIAVVEHQLGRYPRGMVAVGARCVCGLEPPELMPALLRDAKS